MATQARVNSVEAMSTFMAQLINYRDKARSTIEEVTGDVYRTRQWLQLEQRTYWENQIRRRTKLHEEAQQRLYSAQLANLREPTFEERMMARKTKAELEAAQESLTKVKRWHRDYDTRIEPEVRRLDSLHTFLAKDLREAVAQLDAMIKALEAYGEIKPPMPAAANATESDAIEPPLDSTLADIPNSESNPTETGGES